MRHSFKQRFVLGGFLIRPWPLDRQPSGQRGGPQPRVQVAQQTVHEILRATPRVGTVDKPRLELSELTPATLAALAELSTLAPLHQPPALALVRAAIRRWPEARQIGVFDTSWHLT